MKLKLLFILTVRDLTRFHENKHASENFMVYTTLPGRSAAPLAICTCKTINSNMIGKFFMQNGYNISCGITIETALFRKIG
jgi:hypothetical protein